MLVAFVAQAKFMQGTIVFKDGHLEDGFIKSFLEKDFIDMKFFDESIEHGLNLDDKSIKFKTAENGEVRTISIDDIEELRLIYKSGEVGKFKPLWYKKLKGNGEIVDTKKKVWMPVIIEDNRINMYGFEYFDLRGGTSPSVKFYLGRADEDFVIDLFGSVNLMNMGKIDPMSAKFYSELFKDCPEYAKKASSRVMDITPKERKAAKERYYDKRKALKKATSKKSQSEQMFEEYLIPGVQAMIDDYEKSCPQ